MIRISFTPEQSELMECWLDEKGFGTFETWAQESGFAELREPDSEPEWFNADGETVDIITQLWFHIIDLRTAGAKDWF